MSQLEEIADDEDVDFNEQKARAIIEQRDTTHGPWEVAWSAREVLPLINRLRKAEAEARTVFNLEGLGALFCGPSRSCEQGCGFCRPWRHPVRALRLRLRFPRTWGSRRAE